MSERSSKVVDTTMMELLIFIFFVAFLLVGFLAAERRGGGPDDAWAHPDSAWVTAGEYEDLGDSLQNLQDRLDSLDNALEGLEFEGERADSLGLELDESRDTINALERSNGRFRTRIIVLGDSIRVLEASLEMQQGERSGPGPPPCFVDPADKPLAVLDIVVLREGVRVTRHSAFPTGVANVLPWLAQITGTQDLTDEDFEQGADRLYAHGASTESPLGRPCTFFAHLSSDGDLPIRFPRAYAMITKRLQAANSADVIRILEGA